jgi:hypothetical protein
MKRASSIFQHAGMLREVVIVKLFKRVNTKVVPALVGSIAVGLVAALLFVYGSFASTSSHYNSSSSIETNSSSAQSMSMTDSGSNSTQLYSTVHGSAGIRLVEDFGPILTLDQARLLIGTNFTLPSVLPSNLALQEIRGNVTGSDRFTTVALIYSSSTLSKLPNYDRGSMIILLLRDGSIYSPQPSSVVLAKCGVLSVSVPVAENNQHNNAPEFLHRESLHIIIPHPLLTLH